MKERFLLILGWTPCLLVAQNTFQRVDVMAGIAAYHTDITRINDTFFISGLVALSNTQITSYIAKYNSNGDLVAKVLPDSNRMLLTIDAAAINDTTVFVAGNFDTLATYPSRWRFTGLLNPQTGSLYSLNLFVDSLSNRTWSVRDVSATLDNHYLVTGWVSTGHAFLIKADTTGTPVWTRFYQLPSSRATGNSIHIDIDGNYLITSQQLSNDGISTVRSWLFKTDTAGNILWQYQSPIADGKITNTKDFQRTADGGYIYCGVKGTVSPGGSELHMKSYVARLDSNRQKLWDRTYGFLNLSQFSGCIKICEVQDGSFIVAGMDTELAYLAGDPDSITGYYMGGTLTKFSATGDSLWTRYYQYFDTISSSAYHTLTDVQPLPDGGFICGGEAVNLNCPNNICQWSWLFQTDNWGCLVPGCHLLGNKPKPENVETGMVLYPNPVSDILNLSIHYPAAEQGIISIIGEDGRTIRRFQTLLDSATQYQFNVNDLRAGIYLLEILDNKGNRTVQKFIIQ